MTDTARYADIVLPATMFLEHDDLYTAGGHQHLQFAPEGDRSAAGCRSNHEVIVALARRVGAEHPAFAMTPARDHRLDAAGLGLRRPGERSKRRAGSICSRRSRTAHFLNGFGFPDGKFRFKADWAAYAHRQRRPARRLARAAEPARPLGGQRSDRRRAPVQARDVARRATSSTRAFTQTPTSLAREGRPEVLIHPTDAARLGLERWRRRRTRQRARPNAPARAAFPRRAARRARQRRHVAAVGLSRRLGNQRAGRRRQRRAVRRRRVPRRQGVGCGSDRATALKPRPFFAWAGGI